MPSDKILVPTTFTVGSVVGTTCFFRTELGKSINTDEAAAMGAVYQAAHLGKGFKVLTFGVKEANVYPLVVCTLKF